MVITQVGYIILVIAFGVFGVLALALNWRRPGLRNGLDLSLDLGLMPMFSINASENPLKTRS